ncbi:hypothetical protein [Hymenobacter sp. B81]|uniref:hypothetical protein n=1 Tax=Hymenobacter sp. B81 TaxID=3344878 RepID=UPI0037DC0347
MSDSTTYAETDDIDLFLTMHPNGWSTCGICVHRKLYIIRITYVLGDPYYDFMHALMRLINGQQDTSFIWYDEPGGEKITLTKRKTDPEMVWVDVQRFNEGEEKEITDFKPTVSFEIKLRALIIVAYLQLKKTALLLADRNFARVRGSGFPFQKFNEFEKSVGAFTELR